MALFDENTTIEPTTRERMSRRTVAGVWALAVAMVVLLIITFLPTSYVIQRPGPVYNTLGTAENADGEEVPLISVEGAETFPTDGSLDLLTVQVQGNREHTPSWFELAMAWFDPSRAVMPIDSIFPADQTTEERNEESAQMMVDSQHEATAAALTELGYDVGAQLSVYSVIDGAAAEGILEDGDIILEADGEAVTEVSTLRSVINDGDGAPVELVIERDGEQQTVEVTPKELTDESGETTWVLGVNLITDYDFPIDVTIQLNNVGGPSAGMMFALGIIDTLTPDELNGGEQVAGTGTITADGEVGPIGGIRQK
ncbi:MAG TPA: PDZ domain-containing protein, partial [Microbacterium sp.]|uniref:YlbL family protein n=1 Tax=Microbacterium sp. TaxID=51671 RepID=UPI002F956682